MIAKIIPNIKQTKTVKAISFRSLSTASSSLPAPNDCPTKIEMAVAKAPNTI